MRKIPVRVLVADKKKFLKENFHLASMAFDADDKDMKKKILEKIVKKFNYSSYTYLPDIEHSFKRVFIDVKIDRNK